MAGRHCKDDRVNPTGGVSLAAGSAGPDPLTRGLAILALVVSALSLLLAWKAYRRGGARVRVSVSGVHAVDSFIASEVIRFDEVHVTARNRGTAKVQVTRVFCEVQGVEATLEVAQTHHVLEGLHAKTWNESPERLLNLIRQGDDSRDITARRVRACVMLASGERRMSRWTRLSASPER
jgi:hypothetical protein